MPAWPLDDLILQEGYDEAFPDNVVRFGTDTGPGKRRPRSTTAPTPISCLKPLTLADTLTLDSFFKNDLAQGALTFDWKHPRTGAAVSMHFSEKPRYSARGALFMVQMSLEVEA